MTKLRRDTPSPFKQAVPPHKQAIFILAAMPIMMLLFLLPSWAGLFTLDEYFPWTVAASFTLLFAIGNSVLSLAATDQNTYWGRSIMSYVVVAVGGGLIAWLFSGQTVYEAKSFKWIYVVFTFGYLLFLSMVRAMRKIVKIAQDQDARLRGEE